MADSINALGRRKTAVARVYMRPGSGKVVINRKSAEEYFPAWTPDSLNAAVDGDLPALTAFGQGPHPDFKTPGFIGAVCQPLAIGRQGRLLLVV